MSKLFGAVIDFWTWAFVPISWTLNLTPSSFSACCSAPGGHSTPSEIMLSVPVYFSAPDVPPAAGPARAPRPPLPRPDAALDKEVAPAHPELPGDFARSAAGSVKSFVVSSSTYPSCSAYSVRIELVVLAHGNTPFLPPRVVIERYSAAGHASIVTPPLPHIRPEHRMTLYTTAGAGVKWEAKAPQA